MTKTITATVAGTLTALAVLSICALAVSAYADTQDLRDRGSTGRTVEQALTPSPAPSPAPTPTPPLPSGGITNVTSGSVNSGDNTGGNVVTGDEHVEIVVVNIGPTNPPPPPPPPSANPSPTPPPATSSCDGRTRTGCTDTSERTR